jgi:hypothetical protein
MGATPNEGAKPERIGLEKWMNEPRGTMGGFIYAEGKVASPLGRLPQGRRHPWPSALRETLGARGQGLAAAPLNGLPSGGPFRGLALFLYYFIIN